MAKVTGPLFSLAASGSIGGIITYVCGHFAKKKEGEKTEDASEAQLEIEMKWSEGAAVWQSLGENKEFWNEFHKVLWATPECAVNISHIVNGYQLFMSFYMKYGPDGWPGYPLPPTVE